MQFQYGEFSCDVDVYYKEDGLIARFYDSENEQDESQINNLVIVDPGHGFIYIKNKGDVALVGGFVDERVFISDDMIATAVEFIEKLSPVQGDVYTPYHIDVVKVTNYCEYNGEY